MYDPLVPIHTCPYVDTDKAIEHIEHHEKMHQSTAESQKELVLIHQSPCINVFGTHLQFDKSRQAEDLLTAPPGTLQPSDIPGNTRQCTP